MDYLKTDAPFWKKETSEQGSKWVESRKSDLAALKKWVT
jgi:molybdopterin synthase catalytic subunit